MKHALTALALLGTLAATPALAANEPGIDLSTYGYFKGYVVSVSQDDDATGELRNVDIIRDLELHFAGSMTLDNGLTVGVDVGAAADLGDSFDIQDSFAYFSGDWGRVNLGATDGAAYLLQVSAPSVDGNYDGMDQYYTPFHYAGTPMEGIEFDYDQDLSTPTDKLTYLTPVFSGLQAGVSWTPKAGTTSRSLNGVNDEDGLLDVVDLAARFGNETSWGAYTLGAGYSFAEERSLWNIAADFDIGAFGIGAVYTDDDFDDAIAATTVTDQRQYIVGVDYTIDSYVLGASYLNQKNEFGVNDIKTDRYTGGVTYKYGPGVDFRGAVSHIDHDVDAPLGDDLQGTAVMLGTAISF